MAKVCCIFRPKILRNIIAGVKECWKPVVRGNSSQCFMHRFRSTSLRFSHHRDGIYMRMARASEQQQQNYPFLSFFLAFVRHVFLTRHSHHNLARCLHSLCVLAFLLLSRRVSVQGESTSPRKCALSLKPYRKLAFACRKHIHTSARVKLHAYDISVYRSIHFLTANTIRTCTLALISMQPVVLFQIITSFFILIFSRLHFSRFISFNFVPIPFQLVC